MLFFNYFNYLSWLAELASHFFWNFSWISKFKDLQSSISQTSITYQIVA